MSFKLNRRLQRIEKTVEPTEKYDTFDDRIHKLETGEPFNSSSEFVERMRKLAEEDNED